MTEIHNENRYGIQTLESSVNQGLRNLLRDMFMAGSQLDWTALTPGEVIRATKLAGGVLATVNALLPQSVYIVAHSQEGNPETDEFTPEGIEKDEESDEGKEAAQSDDVLKTIDASLAQNELVVAASQPEPVHLDEPVVTPSPDNSVEESVPFPKFTVTIDRPSGVFHDTWNRMVWLLENPLFASDTWYAPSEITALDTDKSIFGLTQNPSILSNVLKLAGFKWNGRLARGARYMIMENVRLVACQGNMDQIDKVSANNDELIEAESAEQNEPEADFLV